MDKSIMPLLALMVFSWSQFSSAKSAYIRLNALLRLISRSRIKTYMDLSHLHKGELLT